MTTPTYTPPAPPKRRKVAVPVAIAAAAAFVVGGFAGGALTASLGEDDDSCKAAVTQANEAIDLYSDSLDLAADGIRGYSNNDPWAIREASDSIGSNSDRLAPVLLEYYTNEQECLGW